METARVTRSTAKAVKDHEQNELPRTVHLPNAQITMPRLGFGVYKIPPSACQEACLAALDLGYRHIDCAQLYRSEAAVGAAVAQYLAQSSLHRSDVFLTTKVFRASRQSDEESYRSLLASVEALGGPGGYVDLFLVHVARFGKDHRRTLWAALERLYDDGKAKAIGVSNFGADHLEEMKEYARLWPPAVNQLERNLVRYCEDNDIVVQAYSPLAAGSRLDDPIVGSIARAYGRSTAQVLLRYSLQKGWVPLVKSRQPDRIKENFDVFGFELGREDMDMLNELDEGANGALFPANIT